jgi:hypothetical protein
MRLGERSSDFDGKGQRCVERQRPPLQTLGQAFAFQILQDKEIDSILSSDIVKRADVRMIQAGNSPRLSLQPLPQLRVSRESRRQHLNRDRTLQPRVAGLIDLSHPAGADGLQDLVGAESRAAIQAHDRIHSASL